MSQADIIALITAALPVIIALSGALYQHLMERLPSHQREVVKGAAALAVTSVDQVGANLSAQEKQQLAKDVMQSVIKSPLVAGNLKLDPKVLEAIIEATVSDLHYGSGGAGGSGPEHESIGFTAPSVIGGGSSDEDGAPGRTPGLWRRRPAASSARAVMPVGFFGGGHRVA